MIPFQRALTLGIIFQVVCEASCHLRCRTAQRLKFIEVNAQFSVTTVTARGSHSGKRTSAL